MAQSNKSMNLMKAAPARTAAFTGYAQCSPDPETMTMPQPTEPLRYPGDAAYERLALRFNLAFHPSMQDWAWEMADPSRADEFLRAYEEPDLSDDERLILMEMILQSFEDLDVELGGDVRWHRALRLLEERITLHMSSVRYWASLSTSENAERWRVAPDVRALLLDYEARCEVGRKAGERADATDEVRDSQGNHGLHR